MLYCATLPVYDRDNDKKNEDIIKADDPKNKKKFLEIINLG